MSAATLTSKGQATIPKDIRTGLGLEAGDRIEFHLLSNGSASMRLKRGTLGQLKGPGLNSLPHSHNLASRHAARALSNPAV